ncbi:MAG: BREX-1 system adenine-specific DNA-methyltransferase PglX, partial [Deltaproteobacteria bacterium]|nr:BREX-1 system adenine-specific DNA-methyltransferase PglX [Deltaproteobacteria bacterium]
MNISKIKTYAPKARRDFIQAVSDKAKLLGLSEKKAEPIDFNGEVAIIGGRAFPRKVGELRQKLEKRIEREGFGQVMEITAYTWFNRFMALRYMEIHNYLDHGLRVLSNRSGSDTPEILEQAANVDLPGLNKEKVIELRLAGNKDDELYRLLLIAQCNALHKAMPFLFEPINNETELLLPNNLLHSNSTIRKMVNDIDEEDWNEVEIIGWIYQFYISEKKDQVIGKVVKSEDIPAATQLFTPNWIVKYMVQNSLGRKWLATYPDSPLRDKMEYYIEPAEQEPEVQEQLDAITPRELHPEEITFLDPACGSGHILVEAYDIFKAIYLERGYRTRDIPGLILEKNLYGLEIDERAAQMAGFALMMRARQDDRRVLSSENAPSLNVMALQSSQGLNVEEVANIMVTEKKEKLVGGDKLFDDLDSQPSLEIRQESGLNKNDIAELIALFEHAKTFGSLIQVPDALVDRLPSISEALKREDKEVFIEILKPLEPIVWQAEILAKKYDCVVTNPP